MTKKVILVWFRNDLRIHDNEILFEAVDKGDIVIPVYFFDPRYFGKNKFDFLNTGILRAKFLIESVSHLKQSLQELGADLLVFQGKPEILIETLCAKYDITEVYHHREVSNRETEVSEQVEAALWKAQINLKHFIGHTLYHKEDLPFPIKDIPDNFNQFKKKVEKESFVRPVIPSVEHIMTHPHLEETAVPTLADLGFEETTTTPDNNEWTQVLPGGEHHGRAHLARTLTETYDDIDDYNLISPYIAHGAISPAYYYHEIKKAQELHKKKRYDKLILRLLWRDYFRFMLKKHPNVFFKDYAEGETIEKSSAALKELLTSNPKDEVISELLETLKKSGNLPYEYREILAAYFLQELHINHLAGASFFEEAFIDYAPATNYGYWLHYAAFGTSSKDNLQLGWNELIKKNYRAKVLEK
ncbi:deoxyribodipyrimidine photolyase [Sphingobacterium psychroaquaticum]|uniref:deoxyribodipyrimidine photo-lyase n=1 Tax=Sphingobacterium psychroaquaticum TaxID=561061 RepID=UPI00106A7547|nr:deoxyribodipyrimidine photo-lyase [Sphingobacterium psychroaquaticum]QBQ42058.1 deoxyribodipyrimidine photolyase [Sphingobacterium psychroaquaticum]